MRVVPIVPVTMTPELRGIPLRSNSETYRVGDGISFKMDFLQQSRHMVAPEVDEIDVIFTGTVGAVTSTALGKDAAKLFDVVKFRDSDDVWNVSGAGSRLLEQMEVGQRQVDPATVASTSTNPTYRYCLRMIFNPPWRAERGRDFAIPIANFLDGGEFTIQTPAGVPPGFNSVQNDWKIHLIAHVRDGRVRELKSRRRVKEEAVTAQEYDYQVNGFLRAAILSSKLPTVSGYTDLSPYTAINSRTLKWPAAYNPLNLVDDYRFNVQAFGTNDEFLAPAYGALGILIPEQYQKTGCMPDMKSLHLDLLAAAPVGGRLITDTVIDRNGDMASLAEGYDSPGALAAAVKKYGVVVGASGNYPVGEFNAQLARKLPLRLKP